MRLAVFMAPFMAALLLAGGFVVNSFDAPDTQVRGLAYAAGSLYTVSSNGMVYRLNPANGQVLGSFSTGVSNPNGLGYAGSLLYVTNGTYTVYKFTTAGGSQGTSILHCPG